MFLTCRSKADLHDFPIHGDFIPPVLGQTHKPRVQIPDNVRVVSSHHSIIELHRLVLALDRQASHFLDHIMSCKTLHLQFLYVATALQCIVLYRAPKFVQSHHIRLQFENISVVF